MLLADSQKETDAESYSEGNRRIAVDNYAVQDPIWKTIQAAGRLSKKTFVWHRLHGIDVG